MLDTTGHARSNKGVKLRVERLNSLTRVEDRTYVYLCEWILWEACRYRHRLSCAARSELGRSPVQVCHDFVKIRISENLSETSGVRYGVKRAAVGDARVARL